LLQTKFLSNLQKKNKNWNKCGGSSIRSSWEIIAEKNIIIEFDKENHNPKINQGKVKENKEQKLKIMTIIIILMWVQYYIDNKQSKGSIIYSLIFFLVHV